MDERYYCGAQPEPGDYQALADLGIKTVVDLRNDPTDYEKSAAEAVGMKYVNIPMKRTGNRRKTGMSRHFWIFLITRKRARFMSIAKPVFTGLALQPRSIVLPNTGGTMTRLTKK